MRELNERAEQQARQLSKLDELNRRAWNVRLDGIEELHENDKAWAKALGKPPLNPSTEGFWAILLVVLVFLGAFFGLHLLLSGGASPWLMLIFFPAVIALLWWWFSKRGEHLDVIIKSFTDAWREYAAGMGLQPRYESQLYPKACHDCKDLKAFRGAETELIEVKGRDEMLQTLSRASAIYDIVSGNLEGFLIELFDTARVEVETHHRSGHHEGESGSTHYENHFYTGTFLLATCPESTPYIRVEPHGRGILDRLFGRAIKVNPEFDRCFRVYASSAQDVDSILQPEVINHLLRHREQQLYIEVTNGLAAFCHRGFLYKSQLPYLMETASYFLRSILQCVGKEPGEVSVALEERLETPEKRSKLKPTQSIELAVPYDKVFDLCISSLNAIKKTKCEIRHQDRSLGKIIAKCAMSFLRHETIVSFDIRKVYDKRTSVIVSCQPYHELLSESAGSGKRRENVESIIGFLKHFGEKQENIITPKKEDKLRPSRSIELNLPYDEAFDLCISSLNTIKKCDIRLQDRTQGKIYAQCGKGLLYAGEIVTFDLCKVDSNRTFVKVSSKPKDEWVVADWGRNRKNVESIIGFLKERNSM